MSTISVRPLGAGQDVGKSCIILKAGGKTVMLDCGLQAGIFGDKMYPDFNLLSKSNSYTEQIDCIIVTHFHIDHCGALPHFTEQLGYDGPIFMTHPTKAIVPILLEDFRKLATEKKGLKDVYTSEQIKSCIKKAVTINIHQTIEIEKDFKITAYYAGHVLGAAMFHIQIGSSSIVYTGDYNMTPDRHLGSAWIEKLRPDVLITESTYGKFVRESKRTREKSFLKNIHYCVSKGGKVLIPVFAVGRAQELFILIETYWERMGLSHVPIYFQAGMTMKANDYYKLFINWTNQKIKDSIIKRNLFDFKYIEPYTKECLTKGGPMVIFSTPAMLGYGASLEIFKKICHDPNNLVLMPGYCVPGSVGAKVLAGHKKIEENYNETIHVNLSVKLLSFSAHADSKGLMQMISHLEPKNVILVHGDKHVMTSLQDRVIKELKINCFTPANGKEIIMKGKEILPIKISNSIINNALLTKDNNQQYNVNGLKLNGLLVINKDQNNKNDIKLITESEARDPANRIPIGQTMLAKTSVKVKLSLTLENEPEFNTKFNKQFNRSLNMIYFILSKKSNIKDLLIIQNDTIVVDKLEIKVEQEKVVDEHIHSQLNINYVYSNDEVAFYKKVINELKKVEVE